MPEEAATPRRSYGYDDPNTGERVSALRDMFNGGGPGASGDAFRGSPIAGLLNALKIRPMGSTAPREDVGFRGRFGSREYFRDMFDGGGAGRSGPTFQDGPYSNLLNILGIRPLGYNAQQQAPLSTFGTQTTQPQPTVQAATTTTPTTPQQDPLLAAAEAAINAAEAGRRAEAFATPTATSAARLGVTQSTLEPSFVDTRTNTQLYGDPLGAGDVTAPYTAPMAEQALFYRNMMRPAYSYTPQQVNEHMMRLFGMSSLPRGR